MEINPLWMLVPLLILIFTGHPIGFVLGAVGLSFGFFFWGPEFLRLLATRVFEIQVNYLLVALPLFIFMGNMLERSGAADKLYEALHIVLGGLKGGLAIATVLICTIFAAATGVIGASVTTMGLLALPGMIRRKYDIELSAGTIMAASCLGILIPPSIMLVVYGAWAGLSVGKLFMAAFLPGLLLSALYLVYIIIRCNINPNLGPPLPAEERVVSIRKKIHLIGVSLLPPIFLILAVLGAIFLGIATPTEAAGLGALGSIIIALANRKFSFSNFLEACYRTARVCGMICVIAAGALCFTSTFLGLGGGQVVKEMLLGLGLGHWGVLVMMMLTLLIMGTFLDWFGILVITIPIFCPIASELGFDPLWFALLICVNLQASFLTPPYGFALFYMKGITPLVAPEVTMGHLIRSALPFILLIICGLIILIIFPEVVLWLPRLMIK